MSEEDGPIQSKIIIIAPKFGIKHEFSMTIPRKEAASKLRLAMLEPTYPFFNMETNDTEYIYPRDWMLHNCMVIVEDCMTGVVKEENKVQSKGKILEFKPKNSE